jgi:hypothetical protein
VASLHPDSPPFQRFIGWGRGSFPQKDQAPAIAQKIAELAAMSSAGPGV